MHGTYQLTETCDGVRVYSYASDLDALIASFPPLAFVDPDPRTLVGKWTIAGLNASASVLLLTIGASSQVEWDDEALVPAAARVVPVATGAQIETSRALAAQEIAKASPAPFELATPIRRSTLNMPATPVEALLPLKTDTAPTEADIVRPPSGALGADTAEDTAAFEVDVLLTPPASASANHGGLTHLTARVDGLVTGQIEFSDANQTVSVNLGSVLAALADRFPTEEYDRLSNSPAAQSFVAIDRLATAGLGISYDPIYDEILIDTGQNGSDIATNQVQEPFSYS